MNDRRPPRPPVEVRTSPRRRKTASGFWQDGRVVTNADLAGRPYLVFFGYTHCPDFCPTALFDISAVFKELGPDKIIFGSDGPEQDSRVELYKIRLLKLPRADEAKILGGNVARLLPAGSI